MTDTRLPGPWLNNMKFDALSDTAFRVFTGSMMWCNENGTDGAIPQRYLRMTHPDGFKPDACDEIQRAGLWARTDDGYAFIDWDGALGQETAEKIELNREKWRRRQRERRVREKDALAKALGKPTAPTFKPSKGDVSGDVTGGRTEGTSAEDVGRGKGPGTASYEGVTEETNVNTQTGEVTDPQPARFESVIEDGKRIRRRVA